MEEMGSPHSESEINEILDNLFRNQSGKMVSRFTRLFGLNRLRMAEDVVQDAFTKAHGVWSDKGLPENPAGWLWQVARNRAIDLLRREKFLQSKEELLDNSESGMPNFISDEELKDDQLRMIFTCCHPGIPEKSQIALTLKILCGFSISEIARAFLSKEATIAKRLTRARKKVSELKIPYEVPAGKELANRLESVLKVLYLLFNEGYSPSSGDEPIRPDLCSEAIQLAKLLVENPATESPQCHALLALMLLNASRFPARLDRDGNLLVLKEQDRSLWDREMISEGLFHLQKSVGSEVVTEYHLQAAISACHSIAESYESTDWKQILSLYNAYSKLNRSPIIALNRAIAVSKVHGPKAGIDEINKINDLKTLESYHLFYSALGDMNLQSGNNKEALKNYQKALELSTVKAEQSFYQKRIKLCEQKLDLADRYSLANSF